jgi:hypothetical protein
VAPGTASAEVPITRDENTSALHGCSRRRSYPTALSAAAAALL